MGVQHWDEERGGCTASVWAWDIKAMRWTCSDLSGRRVHSGCWVLSFHQWGSTRRPSDKSSPTCLYFLHELCCFHAFTFPGAWRCFKCCSCELFSLTRKKVSTIAHNLNDRMWKNRDHKNNEVKRASYSIFFPRQNTFSFHITINYLEISAPYVWTPKIVVHGCYFYWNCVSCWLWTRLGVAVCRAWRRWCGTRPAADLWQVAQIKHTNNCWYVKIWLQMRNWNMPCIRGPYCCLSTHWTNC